MLESGPIVKLTTALKASPPEDSYGMVKLAAPSVPAGSMVKVQVLGVRATEVRLGERSVALPQEIV